MILGITGKTGVGKHTAADFFHQRDWKVLDADKIAHDLYKPYKRVWREVVKHFGEGILTKDDIVDRQKLRELIFSDTEASKKALKDLNAIVHPELKRYLKDEVYYLKKRKKNVVIIAAIWEELDMLEICDKMLLIKAGEHLSFDRLQKKDKMSHKMFEVVCQIQCNPPHPDFVVVNDGDVKAFYKELNRILAEL